MKLSTYLAVLPHLLSGKKHLMALERNHHSSQHHLAVTRCKKVLRDFSSIFLSSNEIEVQPDSSPETKKKKIILYKTV